MINIAEILEFAPKGLKLYSIVHGEVEFNSACDSGEYPINIRYKYGVQSFDKYGKYFNRYGECILFPSSEHRTWGYWQKVLIPQCVGSVIVASNCFCAHKWIVTKKGMFAMNMHENDDNWLHSFEEMTFDGMKFASSKETEVFFERLDKLGYKFENGEVVKKEEKKWSIFDAKDGDFIVNQELNTIFKFNMIFGEKVRRYITYNIDKDSIEKNEEKPYDVYPYSKNGVTIYRQATNDEILMMFEKIKENELRELRSDSINKTVGKNEEKKFTIEDFKPFDKVLVRDDFYKWSVDVYSFFDRVLNKYVATAYNAWDYCVPYNEETAHLLGTTEKYNGKYKTWED